MKRQYLLPGIWLAPVETFKGGQYNNKMASYIACLTPKQ